MPRYTTHLSRTPKLTASRWAEDVPYLPDLEVVDDGPVNTGLVTAEGKEIWRQPEPIGFPLVGDDDEGGHD
jgi:hypothetical protein